MKKDYLSVSALHSQKTGLCTGTQVTAKTAFTLAEVLITLAIIGVVAAMTVPALIQKYNERAAVSRLKKVYATLSHAYDLAVLENGSPLQWGAEITTTTPDDDGDPVVDDYSGMEKVADIFAKYLKVSKRCETGEVCYPYKVFSLDGKTVLDDHTKADSRTAFYLTDGTYIATGYVANIDTSGKYGDILVGLPISKNQTAQRGKNLFYFYMTPKGIMPSGYQGDKIRPFNPYCSKRKNAYGFGCTAWVLQNENFDYLKCDDLDWGKKTKCD